MQIVSKACQCAKITGQPCPTGLPAAVLVEHPKGRFAASEPCAIDALDDGGEWVFAFSVSIREAGDTCTRWLYQVPGATFESVARMALNEARANGHALGRTLVRVWQPECKGNTIGHEPVAEFDLPEGSL